MGYSENVEKFYSYLLELLRSYSLLAELLTGKLDALDRFELDTLDATLKEEQKYVLIARGFDAQIKSHRNRLGFKGETLSEVIDELPGQDRHRFRALFTDLKEKLDEVKLLNQKCQDLITAKILHIETARRRLDGAHYTGNSTAESKSAVTPPQMLSRRI